ncbi:MULTISPECIES: adenosine deaminase [Dietzia]|uniref:Adenosine deaminase n=2 Tax=Dietzia TaxID=37914 RepID=A0A4R3ZPZ0_9ACTN|nr:MULTISPECIES: adenosine deaminase [Dietzia]AVM64197.1 adenosine deaminase [Dietzia sp. oral taxon 368]MCT1864624.1 adenosine deaminase [Dietzia cinnamea]MCT1885649.1 adenosine deaminase [Dietzia cinnamea]MCT2030818.1 adenosine deaminase [Dietzia cinnamea]MCT2034325.1 adenosine deaminase [Dietzia cinnamea]
MTETARRADTAHRADANRRSLTALPKAHLHVHLEAAMREATLRQWCAEDGLEVPPLVDYPDFTRFLDAYGLLIDLLHTPERVEQLLDEVIADAAAQGVVALEFASIPEKAVAFGSAEEALEFQLPVMAEASRRHGVWAGAIVSIDRGAGPEHALEAARLAARFADRGVVAVGLVADERDSPVAAAAEAFAIARDAGLGVVPHAGELGGPEEVRSAVELGADRIQHGVRAVEDPGVLELLAERGTCLDVCPTSNVVLGVSPSLESHPLPALLAAGVRCSIGADDPLLFGADVVDEYVSAHERMGVPEAQLVEVARTSIESSFAPADVKRDALARLGAWEDRAAWQDGGA